MLPAKYLNGNAVLAIPAYAVTQVETNDEIELKKQPVQNTSSRSKLELLVLELCEA